MTSYKAARNLLIDIPSIEKTIFLIDRKDLDTQTTQAFQSYANNDVIDVDETDNVGDLIGKLRNSSQQVIVTTIQKLSIAVKKRLKEGTPAYKRIKDLRVAFIVDECHRAVTPRTQRILSQFFVNSLWYGFTGTPRFDVNAYPAEGDLPRTTEELYGACLHKYTVKEAIRDEAVLGFQTEHLGAHKLNDDDSNEDLSVYETEAHMLQVLDTIINKSQEKLGFKNGRGKTYEAILTVNSIKRAQAYYDLLKRVVNGETSVAVSEETRRVLPDFPKFAITYSVSSDEDNESADLNVPKMQKSLDDYNAMFGTSFGIGEIKGYNTNLNDRLSRKKSKFKSRDEQLDLVIIVSLIQSVVYATDEERQEQHYKNLVIEITEYIEELLSSNPKLGALMQQLWEKVQQSPDEFRDRRVSYVLAEMRKEAIDSVLRDFAEEWCVSLEAVTYTADRYQAGDTDLPGLNNLKNSGDFKSYSAAHEGMPKFKYNQSVKNALLKLLNEDVIPLRDDDYRIDDAAQLI